MEGFSEKNSKSVWSLEAGAEKIIRRLTENGYKAYWAGGAVRDKLLGIRHSDIDIATSAPPETVCSLFPGAVLVGKSFGVVRTPSEGHWYEVATFRRDGRYLDGRHPEGVSYTGDPEVDAHRRDFTVNALFYDPLRNEVLDFVDGRSDLERRWIRAVGDPLHRFREDRLRLLRAVRFATQLDFDIEPRTWEAIVREAHHIHEISAERIRDEILRMLVQPHAGRSFRLLRDSGLLREILPEVERLQGVAQPENFHPEGDVFEHTMLLLDHLEDPTPELALAALFHDIGKPDTYEERDRIRFNGHDKRGAEMFDRIAERLRLPNTMRDRVRTLIAQHMRLAHVEKMRPAKKKRLFRSDHFPELLELHRLDCLASHRKMDVYEYCKAQQEELSTEELKPPRLITGHDLIYFGLKPGPLFGRILSEVEDLQLEGKLTCREEALEYVRRRYLPIRN